MAESITWLHLSDLHANSPRSGWDSRQVTRSLVDDLRRLQSDEGLRPDLILFTGDLAWGRTGGETDRTLEEQFEEGHAFLEAARSVFDPAIPQDNVFLVPGNHDIDRSQVTPQLTDWLDSKTGAKAASVNEMIRKGAREWRAYFDRLVPFGKFLADRGYSHLLTDPLRLTYAVTRHAGGRSIGIAGFNSAWSCSRDGEEGRLWLGGKWQLATLLPEVEKADIKLALVHHPKAWFNTAERNEFWQYGLDEHFHVRLHGHEHDAWVHTGENKLTVSAAACYERSDEANGYNVVRLFPAAHIGEVWLRSYDSRTRKWRGEVVAGKTNPKGMWPLEGLDWLTGDTPPDGSPLPDPQPVNGTPAEMSDGKSPSDLSQKVRKIADAVRSILGPDAAAMHLDAATSGHLVFDSKTVAGGNVTQQHIVVIQVVLPPAGASPDAAKEGSDSIKQQLVEVDALMRRYRLRDAARKLDELLTANATSLKPRDRFRILVKQGNLLSIEQNFPAAAEKYRFAISYAEPEDRHARYFSALADEHEGRLADAHQRIAALRLDTPEFEMPAVVAMLVRTWPAGSTSGDIRLALGEEMCDVPAVAYTLASRELREGDYSTRPATLFGLAEALGTSVFEAYFYVAEKATLKLRCCQGNDREKRCFREVARKSTGLVLDATALAAIYMLELHEVLRYADLFEAWDKEFVVSEHVMSDVRNALRSLSTHGGMQVAKQGDQLVRHETSEVEARKRHERLREFLEAVRARCRLVAAEQPKGEDAKWYGELCSTLGLSGAESVKIATSELGLSLWTEEYYTGELAKPRIGERRLWVQPLVERLVAQRRLKAELAVRVRVSAFGAGYFFIGVSADMLFHAASRNGWKVDGLVRAMMRQYSEPNITAASAVRTSGEFLSKAWRTNARRRKIEVAKSFSKLLLTEMRKRPDGAMMIWHIRRVVNDALLLVDRELARQWRRAVKRLL